MPTLGRGFWNKSRQNASGKDSRGELWSNYGKQASEASLVGGFEQYRVTEESVRALFQLCDDKGEKMTRDSTLRASHSWSTGP